MIPSARQFARWQLPTRWSFIASVVSVLGVVISVVALWVAVTAPKMEDESRASLELRVLVLASAQELRQNSELLSELASLEAGEHLSSGGNPYTVESALILSKKYYGEVTYDAYGEEKYIHQEFFRLKRWLDAIKDVESAEDVLTWNKRQDFTIYDALFLNDFLWWYLHPLMERKLSSNDLKALGWEPYPADKFRVPEELFQSKQFVAEGVTLTEFVDYLSYLD